MEMIFQIIDSYPDDYSAIKKQVKKYIQNGSTVDDNERINILHRPWVAPLNWGIMLYPRADKKWIEEFERKYENNFPPFYKEFLSKINGCFLYDISLFGLTHSLTRTHLQCHDLATANEYWIREFLIDQSYFYFGSGVYSDEENIGYFYRQNKIISILKNGTIINEWNNFLDFLNNELIEAEKKMLLDLPKKISLIITR